MLAGILLKLRSYVWMATILHNFMEIGMKVNDSTLNPMITGDTQLLQRIK